MDSLPLSHQGSPWYIIMMLFLSLEPEKQRLPFNFAVVIVKYLRCFALCPGESIGYMNKWKCKQPNLYWLLGTTEDEMAGWHHGLDGHESEWTPGDGDEQGGLACCDSWGRKELDTTEPLNWTELNFPYKSSGMTSRLCYLATPCACMIQGVKPIPGPFPLKSISLLEQPALGLLCWCQGGPYTFNTDGPIYLEIEVIFMGL